MKSNKTLLSALALAVALSIPLQSYAQKHPLESRSAAWWGLLEQQLNTSINLPVEQIQDETLQHIIFFASNYKDKVDLRELTPRLLEIYENDDNAARRTMALMALHAIGNESSMKRLAELVEEEPEGSIRNITLAVLAEYYNYSS